MAKPALVTLPVVEDLDVFEQVELGLLACVESDRTSDPGDLSFHGRPDDLHGGAVVGIAGTSERESEPGDFGGGGERKRRALAAPSE